MSISTTLGWFGCQQEEHKYAKKIFERFWKKKKRKKLKNEK